MINAAVQKEAFTLAGLLTKVNVQTLAKLNRMMTNDDAANLTKPHIGKCVTDSIRARLGRGSEGFIAVTMRGRKGFSEVTTRGADEFKDTLRGSFRRSTRVREGEFCESIKKGSTANAALCHDAGNNQALGSMPNRSSSLRPSVLSQLPRLIPAADAAASNCDLSSGVIRIWKVGDFPEDECLMSRLIVDMYVPTKLALHQSGTYPNILKPEKETPLKGITSTRQGLTTTVNTSNEVAVMDITTHPQGRDSLTPNKFTWRFLALSANSSHVIRIVANTEREARDQSPAGCVMVFAGRLPVEEVSYVA